MPERVERLRLQRQQAPAKSNFGTEKRRSVLPYSGRVNGSPSTRLIAEGVLNAGHEQDISRTRAAGSGGRASAEKDAFPLSNCSPSIPAGVLEGAVYISNDARTLSMSGGYLGGTNVNNLPPFDFQITLPDGLTIAPLPAALPLFATGVGALGLLGWRRSGRRKRP